MRRAGMWIGSTCLAIAMAAAAAAQAPALDVRMGLWEITSTTEMGGQMPQVDTSKMPPEQRARMEEAMKGMMGAHTTVNKSCMTREKFEKESFMNSERPGLTCTQKIVTNTRTAMESIISCTGQQTMSAQMRIDALSPTSVKGTIKSASTMRGGAVNVNIALTGKWLGPDCGEVK